MSSNSPSVRGKLEPLPPPRRPARRNTPGRALTPVPPLSDPDDAPDATAEPQPAAPVPPAYAGPVPIAQPVYGQQPVYLQQPMYAPAPILAPGQFPMALQPDADPPRSVGIGAILIALVIGAIVAAGVYKASQRLPATYQASSQFLVSISAEGGLGDPVVLAENDKASQYAQLAAAGPVLEAAAAKLKIPAGDLSGKISGSAVAAQNIVQVTATATTGEQATDWAQAVGVALVNYINTNIQAKSGNSFISSAQTFLKPLNDQITSVEKKIATDKKIQKAVDNAILNTLLGERGTEFTTLATYAAGSNPILQMIGSAGGATQTAPKPKEYAIIGFVVAFLIVLRIMYVTGLPGRLLRRRRSA